MRRKNQPKRLYQAPALIPTEIALEQAFLVGSARLLLMVDELEVMNSLEELDQMNASSDFYFEF